jgi:hypothetical protein
LGDDYFPAPPKAPLLVQQREPKGAIVEGNAEVITLRKFPLTNIFAMIIFQHHGTG